MRTLYHLSLLACKSSFTCKNIKDAPYPLPRRLVMDISNLKSCCFITNLDQNSKNFLQDVKRSITMAIKNGHLSCFNYFINLCPRPTSDASFPLDMNDFCDVALNKKSLLCLNVLIEKYKCSVKPQSIIKCGSYEVLKFLVNKKINIPLEALHGFIGTNNKKCFNFLIDSLRNPSGRAGVLTYITGDTITKAIEKKKIYFLRQLIEVAIESNLFVTFSISAWNVRALITNLKNTEKDMRVFQFLINRLRDASLSDVCDILYLLHFINTLEEPADFYEIVINKFSSTRISYLYPGRLFNLIESKTPVNARKHRRFFEILIEQLVFESLSNIGLLKLLERVMFDPDETLYELVTKKILSSNFNYNYNIVTQDMLIKLLRLDKLNVFLDYKNFIHVQDKHRLALHALRLSNLRWLEAILESDDTLEKSMPPCSLDYLILKKELVLDPSHRHEDPYPFGAGPKGPTTNSRGTERGQVGATSRRGKPAMIFLAVQEMNVDMLRRIFEDVLTDTYDNKFFKIRAFEEVVDIISYLRFVREHLHFLALFDEYQEKFAIQLKLM